MIQRKCGNPYCGEFDVSGAEKCPLCGAGFCSKSWIPSPEEIKAACAAIQAKWTPLEERQRRGYQHEPVEVTRARYAVRDGRR